MRWRRSIRNMMRHAWWIILVSGLIAIAINYYNGDSGSLDYVRVTLLVLTLAVLARYAYDSNRIADASEKQLRYQSTPVLTISVERRLLNPNTATSADPTTILYISNDSRHHLEVKVRIILQYGSHTALHTDRYYSGETTWNMGPKETSNGNFKILPFFKDLGDSSKSMLDKLNQAQQRLKIFIFSEYKSFEDAGCTFSQNMTKTYWLKDEAVPSNWITISGSAIPLPFVWVLEFESPPEAIKQFAKEGGKTQASS